MSDLDSRKSVHIELATHALMSKETKRLKHKQSVYVEAAVRYFAERGLDPVATQAREGQLIMSQIGHLQQDFKKLGDRLFSYIVEQENTIHLPLLAELVRARVTEEKALRILQAVDAVVQRQGKEYLEKNRAEDQREIDTIVQRVLDSMQKPGADSKVGGLL